ncbi:hypothetical protein BTL50_06185 [Bordetella holmesii]|nr:hypothetical protein H558_12350 [Bordetella holmesii H558]AMD50525.1 hypothetical protein F783_005715 [Bordetella holmesii F627]AOB35111.1 hypothetical protein BBB42_06115 [Bordetella holmesii]AUL19110.1 hypothetical protein BTL46_06155 [Bordetella holmesii]AUL22434.1 hypothetical protein BTL48_06190 [Bordetella holmesii]
MTSEAWAGRGYPLEIEKEYCGGGSGNVDACWLSIMHNGVPEDAVVVSWQPTGPAAQVDQL